jgi:hypothetical protein
MKLLPTPDLIPATTKLGERINLNALEAQFEHNNFLLERFDPALRAEAMKGRAVLELWDQWDKLQELRGKK